MPFPKIVAGGRDGHSAARRDHAGSSSVLRAVTMRNCCCATQRKAKRVAIASKSENRNFTDRREQRGLSVPRARSHQRCHHLFGFGLLASKHQGPRSLVKFNSIFPVSDPLCRDPWTPENCVEAQVGLLQSQIAFRDA